MSSTVTKCMTKDIDIIWLCNNIVNSLLAFKAMKSGAICLVIENKSQNSTCSISSQTLCNKTSLPWKFTVQHALSLSAWDNVDIKSRPTSQTCMKCFGYNYRDELIKLT